MNYELFAENELKQWQLQMLRRPGIFSRLSQRTQAKINSYFPEKVHRGITTVIKQMIRGVLFGAKYTTSAPLLQIGLFEREAIVKEKINFYRSTAAIEGGVTGAGGFFLGLADFPILLTLKLKLLYEIAASYGFDLSDYKERVYLLHIFELAFSSREHSRKVYLKILDWETQSKKLPEDINVFDWRSLQQQYRDYLDLAKMAQLLPVIGAPVGIIANYTLIKKLGVTAMNAYRLRLLPYNRVVEGL
ncbi:MAG TPA: EcsC family protein [Niabella sp.]|nr:EcsC family protein [Niabella sp.]HOZ97397.1 EcsC family protein [Niabella sp.]HQW15235.1 EcsC family protein [Niabella sp.]HQX20297.1 EcsC family protein [Niabella sp.]HQX42291.1 EcsC family protein [Niabella sp.]